MTALVISSNRVERDVCMANSCVCRSNPTAWKSLRWMDGWWSVAVCNNSAQCRHASEKFDSLLIFTSKHLRFAPLDQHGQTSVEQFGVHAVEI